MANRVVLGAFNGTYVLRVSRPGYNVLDPALPPERLVFDSRWAEANNCFAVGSVTFGGQDRDVYFGETFAWNAIPLVVFIPRMSGGVYSNFAYSTADGPENHRGHAAVHVFQDRARFRASVMPKYGDSYGYPIATGGMYLFFRNLV